jgi:hypothetical protein
VSQHGSLHIKGKRSVARLWKDDISKANRCATNHWTVLESSNHSTLVLLADGQYLKCTVVKVFMRT